MDLDFKLVTLTFLQAIARMNLTKVSKYSGFIIDYFWMIVYPFEVLEIFFNTDLQGPLKNVKDVPPKL